MQLATVGNISARFGPALWSRRIGRGYHEMLRKTAVESMVHSASAACGARNLGSATLPANTRWSNRPGSAPLDPGGRHVKYLSRWIRWLLSEW